MNRLFLSIFFVMIGVFIIPLFAQPNRVVQFSGVVLSRDSLKPVSFAHIIDKTARTGGIADYYGFFSFATKPGDTIVFSSIGYKKGVYIIPDTLVENKYSLIQLLSQDTVMLAETVIYPWPTKEQFKYAFLHIDIPDDDLERAKNNLSLQEMKTRMENMPMDGSMNYKNYINNYTSKLYYIGQLPPNNLLNPLAWAQFIEAWRSGKFKNN